MDILCKIFSSNVARSFRSMSSNAAGTFKVLVLCVTILKQVIPDILFERMSSDPTVAHKAWRTSVNEIV